MAARAARGQAEPPALLRRAWRIQRWPSAPIETMSAREYLVMLHLERVYMTVREFTSAANVTDLAKRNPDGWKLMSQLRTLENA